MQKTILSFYCDDTNPYTASPEAFKIFLDFISTEGIAGESSVILGYGLAEHGLLSRPTTDLQRAYISQLQRAYTCGVDTHFELMTHAGLYDFEADRLPANAMHEGLWLYEPNISVEEYEAYFANILVEGERIGVRFTGMTWPGCGCAACTLRYRQLWAKNSKEIWAKFKRTGLDFHKLKTTLQELSRGPDPNPNVWQALLNLAKQGRFREHTVPCFFGNDRKHCAARLMDCEEDYGVYDLPPVAADRLGMWLNDPQKVNTDYYITADGKSGRIVELVHAEAPYCLLYAHWQGLNPANGTGWNAFTRVVNRVKRHLKDQIIWMRPSQYTNLMFQNSGNGLSEKMFMQGEK